jgi:hypothetical protein
VSALIFGRNEKKTVTAILIAAAFYLLNLSKMGILNPMIKAEARI